MENTYYININTFLDQRTIKVIDCKIDEAVSFGIVMFDKYATRIGDRILISEQKPAPKYCKAVRSIELKEGLRIEVKVL